MHQMFISFELILFSFLPVDYLMMLISCFPQNLESLEAQLADALSDRSKATETISSLQVRTFYKILKLKEKSD